MARAKRPASRDRLQAKMAKSANVGEDIMDYPTENPTLGVNPFRHLALAASILLFLLIVMGGIVHATGSTGACLGWPACQGQWTPPAGQSALFDYAHRVMVLAASLLLAAAGVEAWKHYRSQHWISRPVFLALGLMAIQVGLGAFLSLPSAQDGSAWLPAAHLLLSLLALAGVLAATTAAFYYLSGPRFLKENGVLGLHKNGFLKQSLATLAALFLVMASGAWLAASPSAWISLAHGLTVGLAGGLLLASFLKAWRTQRSQTPVLVAATAANVLFFAQALLGAKLINGLPVYLLALHQATSIAAWAALVVQTVTAALSKQTVEEKASEPVALRGRKGLAKDLLMLTKPVVVALLLVTTYAGMVIGGRAWPGLGVTFWTLLGGFMAAGGSGAINQYIDRFDDGKMQRTQKRPIPAGRLTPGEGLAFGVGMALASFYLMVAFTNLLAALLTLAGIIYYVLIYSIFLKKATVQNIVIGGGAGAIPPLVGWAAATGSLNVPSLFLFAIVFMWTPPHFWSLALVRRNDYARAGVPMLPVVRGEKETRWQILIYTAELVALTLLLPVFGLGGSLYLVGAAALGGWLMLAAWKVWKTEGNKVAWKMYRYSSMYLAFLFAVLMVDRLLK